MCVWPVGFGHLPYFLCLGTRWQVRYSIGDMPVSPPSPVGLADELVEEIAHFRDVARVVLGVRGLKIFSFGPRPHDFYACNAPIAQLYRMGIEVMENSELDLLSCTSLALRYSLRRYGVSPGTFRRSGMFGPH